MTAKSASRLVPGGVWVTLRTLRDQWVLIVFFGTALFWARDVYDRFIDLPSRIAEVQHGLVDLRSDITRLDQAVVSPRRDRSAVLNFPGAHHAIADGARGSLVAVRLAPVEMVRSDCSARDLSAFMIDATETWYSVEIGLQRLPSLAQTQDLAFEVRVHPRMALGRARFLVEIAFDCGSHLQVDRSPILPFRVVPSEHR